MEELVDLIKDIMIKHGPDGHTDGSEELAKFTMDIAIKFLQYYYHGAPSDNKLIKKSFNLFMKDYGN